MTTQIKQLTHRVHKKKTIDINTIIAEHNMGTQIMLAALTDGTFVAMWVDGGQNEYETEVLPEHFEYLCKHADENTELWFDFELHDTVDVEPYMDKYPHIPHV
ncbi:MAG: hypothetical protein CMF61_03385 [Magnetococcales bacterium]|nr:hypothetical protein [Magnetococcales bacterium]|tara:strand:- start:52 stop:360 length:309 start_codon:yes stop_codon:yes gene_type:complete